MTVRPITLLSPSQPTLSLESKLIGLRQTLRDMGRVIVAVSGGVDSALLWRVAYEELDGNALAVTALSPSLASWERDDITRLAQEIAGPHRYVKTNEVENPSYAANPSDRCYFCKHTLWQTLAVLAADERYPYIIDGYNLDDVGDYRPGQQAGDEFRIRSPLKENGFSKADVRTAGRELGLSVWDKPAMACLASRFAYGVGIDAKGLDKVDRAEAWLRERGLRQCRVRVHDGNLVRIEVESQDISLIVEWRQQFVEFMSGLGFDYVTLDLEGFRSGSMNVVLEVE